MRVASLPSLRLPHQRLLCPRPKHVSVTLLLLVFFALSFGSSIPFPIESTSELPGDDASTACLGVKILIDTLANAAVPIRDERRQTLLKDQADKLARQTRLVLVGPDLDRFERHVARFNKVFW